jgi:DNA-directed RNA polymerase alpha subunit/DNA-directed RNA polymerase subunit L
MNPSIQFKLEENGSYQFTLSGVHVSFANAIRRVVLSDIKTVCIDAENCVFETNNTRLHNEILKERLNGIPVHTKELEEFVSHCFVEVDVTNDTDNILYVTTEDFKIKRKDTKQPIAEDLRNQIFPKNSMTGFYIDFARLGSFVDNMIEKEQIKFRADFVVRTAKDNGLYSVVSKCTFENTKDPEKRLQQWKEREKKMLKEWADVDALSEVPDITKPDITKRLAFEERDFQALDAQRYFIDHSFDFTIDSIGVYTNQEIVSKACIVLQNLFYDFKNDMETTDVYPIIKSSYSQEHPSTIENSFDVILHSLDYTFGNILSYIVYDKFFVDKQILTYCGFKKFHPHDTYSVLRIAFREKVDLEDVRSKLIEAANVANGVFTKIYGLVKA